MQIKLDNRLKAVAELVLPGSSTADIGTDHGYLPVYLVQKHICPYVVASDKAQLPYENTTQLIKTLNLTDFIDVRRGEGLEVLKPGETATIVLAGMGGYLICNILEAAFDVLAKTERLVLQPQKHADKLRLWLVEHNWRIVRESIAFDNGFYYVVIAATPGRMILNADEIFFGPCLLKESPPLFFHYLDFMLRQSEALIDQLKDFPRAKIHKRICELEAQAQRIREILRARADR